MTSDDKRGEAKAAQAAVAAINKASGGKVVSNGTPSPEPPPIPKKVPVRIPVREPLANPPRVVSPGGATPRSSQAPTGTQERRVIQVIPPRPPSGGAGGSGAGNGKNQSTNAPSGGIGNWMKKFEIGGRLVKFAGIMLVMLAVLEVLYLRDRGHESDDISAAVTRSHTETTARKAAAFAMIEEAKAIEAMAEAKAKERQSEIQKPQPVIQRTQQVQPSSRREVQVLTGPTNIGSGHTTVQLDFAVSNSYGCLAQAKAFDGRTCTTSGACTTLMADLTKDLTVPVVNRQVEIDVGSNCPGHPTYHIGVQ